MIRTRFAPSPTGYLHIGGARTALFSWAYARKHGGKFILRIEDTDLERSTEASVQAIIDGMRWLELDWDEGPFYQMKRLDRYRDITEMLLSRGLAYRCYASREDLDAMREAQRARGEKPRYDGRWRDSKETPPAGVEPVIRFKNPRGIDFAYLLSMISESYMSRANTIVVPGGRMDLAMQLILTPLLLRLMDIRRAQHH